MAYRDGEQSHFNRTKYSPTRFRCLLCKKILQSRRSLEHHMNIHEGKYKCPLCGHCSGNELTSEAHSRTHSRIKLSPVSSCGHKIDKGGSAFEVKVEVDSNHIAELSGHFSTSHDKGECLVCSTCATSFCDREQLHRHQATHCGKTFSCSLCKKILQTRCGLKYHMNIHQGRYKCSSCDKRFGNKYRLESHIKSHSTGLSLHDKPRPYVCTICKKGFMSNGGLYRHKTECQCSTCSLCFGDKTKLYIHQMKHSGEVFNCSLCEKPFQSLLGLNAHMNIHDGKYKCAECGKCFGAKAALETHSRVHTGEKPFRCGVCGKGFSNRYALKDHERLHTGEKPYRCHVCPKEFTKSSTLSAHMVVHTGERSHMCSLCGRRFTRLQYLNSHKCLVAEKP